MRTKAGNPEKNHTGRMTALPKKKFAEILVRGHEECALRTCLCEYFVIGKSGSCFGDVENYVTVFPQAADDGAIDALVCDKIHAALIG